MNRTADPAAKLLAGALLLAPLIGCSEPAPEPEPLIRPVISEVVNSEGSGRTATFAGSAQAGVESRLSFRVNGTIDKIFVEIGDVVRAGQVLARLDPIDYELQLQEAIASLAQTEAAERQAKADYDRVRALYENNNTSKSELDAARARAESSLAQVSAAAQRVEQARRQVGYTRLTAPSAGTIADVMAEVNESTQSGSAVLLLTSGAHPEVRAAVPEVLIASIRDGQIVEVEFDALPGQLFPATVTEVGVAATGSATFDVTVRLDGSPEGVRSGMAAEVTLDFPGDDLPTMFVPPVAVGEDHNGRFVYVLEPAEGGTATAHRRPVEVGELTPNGLEVRSGIRGGERIATVGVRRLADGMLVRFDAGDAEGSGG